MIADLHCHLSGSTDLVVLYELLKGSGYKIPAKDYWEFANHMLMKKENVKNLDEYLAILHTIDKIQSFPLAIEQSVYNSFTSAYLAGAEYHELRFNPAKRSQDGKIDLDAVIISARAGMERAKLTFGIKGGLVLCLGRDMSPEANQAVFNKAKRYHKKGVLGIDIAGPYCDKEVPQMFYGSRHRFDLMYAEAFDLGMTTTVHAGETDHEYVQGELAYVLNVLKPQRIGHGIQIFRFPELVAQAKEDNVLFEFCPTSNLTTGVIKDMMALLDVVSNFNVHKLRHVVCTDATFLLNTDIKKENDLYDAAMQSLAWTEEDKQAGLGPCILELEQ